MKKSEEAPAWFTELILSGASPVGIIRDLFEGPRVKPKIPVNPYR